MKQRLHKKRVWSAIISLCCILSVLTSCSSQESTASSSAPDPADSPAASKSETAADSGAPVELSLYTYWIPATNIQSYDEIKGLTEIANIANVHITWRTPSAGQNELEAFNIMLAAGDYPDIIQHRWSDYPGGLQKLISDGVIQPLDPYFEQGLAPAYQKILEEDDEIWRQVSLSDGTIAHFSTLELDLKRAAYEGLVVRGDWLDALNLEPPETVDEFYTVLKAFKEQDPNGNGQADEIPYAAEKTLAGIKRLIAPFGVIMDFSLDPGSGKIVYGPAQPAYRDAVETLAKWYAEGLIDSECVSIDTKTLDAKVTSGIVGSVSASVSGMTTYLNYARSQNPEFELVPIPYLTGPAGKPYADNRERVMYSGRRGAALSTTCKDPQAALRYLDCFYAEDTRDYAIWGIEGESYTVGSDGKKHYTDIIKNDPDGLPMTQALNKWAIPVWGWFKPFDIEAAYEVDMNTPITVEANELWWAADMSILPPVLQLPADEAQEYANIMNEVTTYVLESTVKFMIGTASMEEYDDYLSTLQSMNIDRAVEIQQAAYDNYSQKTRK